MAARAKGKQRFLATVLFTDIVGSTDVASELGDRRWRELLDRHHAIVRRELKRSGGREIDTAGDGFFATFDAPADGIRCACAASDSVRELGVDIRAGLHVGECETIGKKVGGIAVHTGARVLSASGPHDVVVTATTRDLVAGSDIEFEDAGVHQLKGIPGEWRLFRVSSVDGAPRGVALDEETKRQRQGAIQPTPLLARRRSVLAVVGVVVLAAIVVSAFLLSRHGSVVPGANTVAEIPAGGTTFTDAISVGVSPDGVAAGEGSIWVINAGDGTVQRIDPSSRTVIAVKSTNGTPTGVATGEGAVWVTTGFGSTSPGASPLDRVDPVSNDVRPVFPSSVPSSAKAIAVGDGALWVADAVDGQVVRIDPNTGSSRPIAVGDQPAAVAVGSDPAAPVWVSDTLGARLWRIDPSSLKPTSFNVPAPSALAVAGNGDVWVTSTATNSVVRLSPAGQTVATVEAGVPSTPDSIAVSGDGVWVGSSAAHAVVRIDGSTNKVTDTVRLEGAPTGLAADASGNVWASVGSS